MIMTFFKSAVLSLLLSLTALWGSVHGAETPWITEGNYLRTRLITGGASDEEPLLFGWEADLFEGWKTYWRAPGEAGIPVTAQLEGAPIELLYPVPYRFDFYGTQSIGYEGKVTIPFYLPRTAVEAGKQLVIGYMVCKDICIPLEARYDLSTLDMTTDSTVADLRLASWMQKVPLAMAETEALAVRNVRLVGVQGHQKLVVDILGQNRLDKMDIFVAAPDGTAFEAPQIRVRSEGREARAVISALMRPSKVQDLAGQRLRLTITDGRGIAVDHFVDLAS